MTDREFTEDVSRYGDMLFRIAYGCTGNLSVCDDIVQEVLLKYYRADKKFNDEESKKAWLIRITVNKCHDFTKSPWNKRRAEITGNEYINESDKDELVALSEALKRLRPIYRDVICLHYYEGYTAAQIAGILHLSTPAITSRLKRGREMLKGFLE